MIVLTILPKAMQDVCFSTIVLLAKSVGPDFMTYDSMDLEASWVVRNERICLSHTFPCERCVFFTHLVLVQDGLKMLSSKVYNR